MVIYHIFMWAGLRKFPIYKLSLQWLFFFLPWFYFKSGMFHEINKKIPIKDYVYKNFNRLIFPLILWTGIGLLIALPKMIFFDHKPLWKILILPFYRIVSSGDTFGNPPLWFLLSLFIVKICGYYLLKLKQYLTAIILTIVLISGIFLNKSSLLLPFGIHNITLGLIFYCAGYFYKEKAATRKINISIFIFLVAIFFLLNSFYSSYIDIHLNHLIYGSYIGYIFLSIFAIILSIHFLEDQNIKLLAWVGKKSIYILVLHWPILTIIITLFREYNFPIEGYKFSYILFLVSFPALLFLSSILPEKIIAHSRLSHITSRKHPRAKY